MGSGAGPTEEGALQLALKNKLSMLQNSVCQEHMECGTKEGLLRFSLYIFGHGMHFIKLVF